MVYFATCFTIKMSDFAVFLSFTLLIIICLLTLLISSRRKNRNDNARSDHQIQKLRNASDRVNNQRANLTSKTEAHETTELERKFNTQLHISPQIEKTPSIQRDMTSTSAKTEQPDVRRSDRTQLQITSFIEETSLIQREMTSTPKTEKPEVRRSGRKSKTPDRYICFSN